LVAVSATARSATAFGSEPLAALTSLRAGTNSSTTDYPFALPLCPMPPGSTVLGSGPAIALTATTS
jgi:hypothetical protein